MTELTPFERDLSAALAKATTGVVRPFDAAELARAAASQGRPRRGFFLRQRPLRVRQPSWPAPRARAVWLLVILALLVAAAVVVVGSQRRLAPPFGVAMNGIVAYSVDGDLFARDLETGDVRPLVVAPEFDVSPIFSRSGNSLAFIRLQLNGQPPESLMVGNADGGDVRRLVGPELGLDWWEWSPDGSSIALISRLAGPPGLAVVNTAGAPIRRAIELPVVPEYVLWRPPGGRELVFRGIDRDGRSGIHAVRPDGSEYRAIIAGGAAPGESHLGLYSTSPDGRVLAYTGYDGSSRLRVHLLDLDAGTSEVRVGPAPEGFAVFSPDGSHIALTRYTEERAGMVTAQVFVAPVAGGDGVAVGPSARFPADRQGFSYDFSPDGTKVVIVDREQGGAWLADATGGPGVAVPWETPDLPGWQRLGASP